MIHDLTSDISFLYCEFIMNDVHFDNIYHLGRFVKTVLTYFFFLMSNRSFQHYQHCNKA